MTRERLCYGQVRDDQEAIALLMTISGALLLGSIALMVWPRIYTGKRRLITGLLCVGAVVFNALAYWNACTAIVGQKDRLF